MEILKYQGNGNSDGASNGGIIISAIKTLLPPLSDVITYLGMVEYYALVTVEIATTLLANPLNRNRRLNREALRRLTTAMTEREYIVNPFPLCADTSGRFFDGQHRCRGVIDSGIPQIFKIVENCDPRLANITDHNAPRGLKDDLIIAGVCEENAEAIATASAINIIGRNIHGWSGKIIFAKASRLEQIHHKALKWATENSSAATRFAPILAALVYAYPANPETISQIADELIYGALPGDPIFLLREILAKKNKIAGDTARLILFRKALCAIYARLHGERPSKLQATDSKVEWFKKLHKAV